MWLRAGGPVSTYSAASSNAWSSAAHQLAGIWRGVIYLFLALRPQSPMDKVSVVLLNAKIESWVIFDLAEDGECCCCFC